MKLYATTTSERASKGQGGEWLDINITDENEEIVAQFKLRTKKDSIGELYCIDTVIREDVYVDGHHWLDSEIVSKPDEINILKEYRKGNKKKDECDMSDCGYEKPHGMELHNSSYRSG